MEVEDKVYKELSEIINEEITHEILRPLYKEKSYIYCYVNSYSEITELWCTTNLRFEYQCFGHYWYFSNEEDAAIFQLTWG